MNITSLQYFIAVAEAGNFTRASERLFISQPTLSRHVQELEEELGVQLLVRNHNSVDLTQTGHRVLREAKSIVAQCDNLPNIVHSESTETGFLRIGYQGFMNTSTLYFALREFAKTNPFADIQLMRNNANKLSHEMMLGHLDIALTVRAAVENLPGIRSEHLATNRLQIALPTTHDLAKSERINLAQLRNENLITLNREVSPRTVDYTMELCLESGYSPRFSYFVDNIETALMLVGAGKGITFFYSLMGSPHMSSHGICAVDIDGAGNEFDLMAAYPLESDNLLVRPFVEQLREQAKSLEDAEPTYPFIASPAPQEQPPQGQ